MIAAENLAQGVDAVASPREQLGNRGKAARFDQVHPRFSEIGREQIGHGFDIILQLGMIEDIIERNPDMVFADQLNGIVNMIGKRSEEHTSELQTLMRTS